jgi:hypothetical protein
MEVSSMNSRTRAVLAVLVAAALGVSAYVLLVSGSSGPPSPSAPASTCLTPPIVPYAGGETSADGNWTTYHQNSARTGVQMGASITAAQPQWTGPTALDGQVFAEPLICGDSVFVATENDSVYSVNATTGGIDWRTNLGTPVPGPSLPCGDIDPSGITGTPVIDVATSTLYVVAFLNAPAGDEHILFGLDTDTGAVTSQRDVDAAGSIPDVEQERGALALANGVVYIPYGGLAGDCGAYHGWVVGVPTSGGSLLSYQVPTSREGGIWSPAGITVSPSGNLYVSTGNGAATSGFDYGDSVIELSPSLGVLGYFAPVNWAQLNADDTDLGSVAPTVLPNGELFQIGKAGVGYVLSGTNLGGIGGQLYNDSICSGGYGGTAHIGQSVIVPCTNGLFDVVVGPSTFSVAWQTESFDAGSPIVTGDLVWAVNISTADLLAFNLSSGHEVYSFPLGSADHFITPAADPESLFVAGGSQLFAFSIS